MPSTKGYRSDRLRRRRRSRIERSQAWLLYLLAAAVAFAAVLGAWYISGRFSKDQTEARKSGYLAAIQLTAPDQASPVAALLVVQDPAGGDPGVYFLPPDVLLEGPNGEYVFAGDSMAAGTLAKDLGRVVNVPIDAVYTLPASDLARWAGTDQLQVQLDRPVAADINDHTLLVKDGGMVTAADLPAVFADAGGERLDLTELQTALVKSALEAAALRPAAERARLAGASPSPQAGPALQEVLQRITAGSAVVERFPAGTRVAEGQFAFVPNPAEIQAGITRRSPAYHAAVTVQVLNGSGKLGVGAAVLERLTSLDVNLPRPLNADSFSYRQTQILAGPGTLPVAQDIRAILGRGVVLDGSQLPKGTVRVVVVADFKAPQSTKDQP